MTIYSIQPLLTFIINIFLILLVLINNRNKNIVLPYILWNVSTAIWNLGFFLLYNTAEYSLALKYNHLLITGTVFIFSTTFHFIYNVADIKTKLNKILLYLAYVFSFLFLLLHFKSNILSNEIKKYFFGYYPLADTGDIIYSIVFAFYIIYSQVLIFRLIKISSGQKKQEYQYIFWGTAVGVFGGIINFLPPFGIEFYPFGNLTSIFYSIAIAYAFVRIKMVNLQYLLRKILEYLAILSVTIIFNIVIVYILLPSHIHRISFFLTLIFITFITFIFLKVFSDKIRTFINVKFYANNLNFGKSIQLLTLKIRSILDEKQLVESLLNEIPQIFMVDKGSIRIFGKAGLIISGEFECNDLNKVSYNLKEAVENKFDIFLNCFKNVEEIIIRDELQKKMETGRILTEPEMKIFNGINAGNYAAAILVNKNLEIKGCILLGNKLSGDMFYKDELDGLILLKNAIETALYNIQNINLVKDQQKKIDMEFVKSQKLESIGVFAGGIAHDFNNILTAILGNISLARRYGQNPDEVHELLFEAEKASLQAKELTKQLLTFAQGGKPIKKVLSISKLLKDTVIFISRGFNVKLNFMIYDNLWQVEFDEIQMIQVINNLIINAVESMSKGGVIQISAENIDIKEKNTLLLKEGEYVKITIKDEGIGVAKEHILKIFDPYWTTKPKGSGLGLATVYSIIRKHEGYINVESEIGKGTTFYIYIPASKDKATSG